MKNILVITYGQKPMPAVNGGAVETQLQLLIEKNELNPRFNFTIYSIFDKKALEKISNYKYTKFKYIRKNSLKYIYYYVVYFLFRCIRKICNCFCLSKFKKIILPYPFIKCVIDEIILNNNDYNSVLLKHYPYYAWFIKKAIPSVPILSCVEYDGVNNNTENVNKIAYSTDVFIGVSSYIKKRIENSIDSKICCELCYNGIENDIFKPIEDIRQKILLRNKLCIKENQFVFIFTGRVISQKGIIELCEAYGRLADKNILLLIVGGGDDYGFEKELQKLIRKIKNEIRFIGRVSHEDIVNYYQIADIAVLPSTCEEAFGLTIVEALSCGLPVITTNAGGIPEIMNEKCGIMLNNDSNLTENLFYTMRKILEGTFDITAWRREAIEVSSNFSKEKYIETMFKLLEKY